MKKKLPSGSFFFFIFVVGILLWLILIPLGQMVISSFRAGHPAAPGPFTLSNYLVAYTSPLTYRMILNTLVFAGAGTAITVFIAVLFAWLLERTDMPLRNLCWTLLLIPMAMPGLLFSMSYVLLFMPQSGIINVFVRDLLGVIRALNGKGLTILLVEQNVAVSLKISHHAYVLENGRVVRSGTGNELLGDERVRQAYLGS